MSAVKKKIQGSIVALVTPFRNGKVDEPTLKKLVEFHLESGTDVILPCGTTGESATMTHDEHRRVMSLVIEQVRGRVPVICGAGSNSTAEASGLVQYAEKAGADGVLVVTPYYNKPTQEGLFRHYAYLADHTHLPIVLYNVPGRTGISMAPEIVAKLYKKFSNIIAIKEASGSLDQVDQIFQLCDITVLSGEDSLTFPLMTLGARGVISVTANVVPRLVSDMVHAALEGNWNRACELHRVHYPLAKVLFVESNPIPVKAALGLMKKIDPELRLPLCPISSDNLKKVKKVLKDLKVIA